MFWVTPFILDELPLDPLVGNGPLVNWVAAGTVGGVYGLGFVLAAAVLRRGHLASWGLAFKGGLMASLLLGLAIVVYNTVGPNDLPSYPWLDVLCYSLFGSFYVLSWLLMKNPPAHTKRGG
jgi:predicted membrane protein